MSKKVRGWVIVLNNYEEEEYNQLIQISRQVKYYVVAKEVGELEHTPHLQCYFYFHNAKNFSQAKKFFPIRCHIEQAQGSPDQNVAYCTKDGDYVEFGEKPKMGKRTDIDTVKQLFKEGVRLDQIVLESTSYQSARHAEMLYKYQSPVSVKREIRWYYGKTGSGKTRSAIEESEDDYWISGRSLKWWDGYFGQKYIIVDDFRRDFCTFHELLRILDRYPYRVETKGSSMYLQDSSTHIIITTPLSPQETYENRTEEDIEQLIRRIDIIKEF